MADPKEKSCCLLECDDHCAINVSPDDIPSVTCYQTCCSVLFKCHWWLTLSPKFPPSSSSSERQESHSATQPWLFYLIFLLLLKVDSRLFFKCFRESLRSRLALLPYLFRAMHPRIPRTLLRWPSPISSSFILSLFCYELRCAAHRLKLTLQVVASKRVASLVAVNAAGTSMTKNSLQTRGVASWNIEILILILNSLQTRGV